jgi:Holliday junction resolvasome RuvABC endonuclease subunit
MTRILSIDPGIKHLSYCYLSVENGKIEILDWNNLCITEANCKTISFEILIDQLLETLALQFDDAFLADIVIIENQPLKNNKMKSVSVAIFTYFNMLKIQFGNIEKVKFIRATEKLKCRRCQELPQVLGKASYKDRKQTSIQLCRLYLKDISPEKLEWLDTQRKRDDMTDAMLAAIYYIENTIKIKI